MNLSNRYHGRKKKSKDGGGLGRNHAAIEEFLGMEARRPSGEGS
jgi:hypothetical protein